MQFGFRVGLMFGKIFDEVAVAFRLEHFVVIVDSSLVHQDEVRGINIKTNP